MLKMGNQAARKCAARKCVQNYKVSVCLKGFRWVEMKAEVLLVTCKRDLNASKFLTFLKFLMAYCLMSNGFLHLTWALYT